jgi:hypothetical protein
MQKQIAKMESGLKTEQETPELQKKSTVNLEKSTQKVNGQPCKVNTKSHQSTPRRSTINELMWR